MMRFVLTLTLIAAVVHAWSVKKQSLVEFPETEGSVVYPPTYEYNVQGNIVDVSF
jgi:hypothetical protein